MLIEIFLATGGLSALRQPFMIPLPRPQQEIVVRVAGSGKPNCTSYYPDGSTQRCFPIFGLRSSEAINGWSHEGQIQFSTAAIRKLNSFELALLAGHEIAHFYLDHRKSGVSDELEADRIGALLACHAGYDPRRALTLLDRIPSGRTHPSAEERKRVISDSVANLECSP